MAPNESIRMICFDVDGTLIAHAEHKTVWQVLNEHFLDSRELNRERFEAFREGRLGYAEWVALDVGDWQRAGIRREAVVAVIRDELHPVAGARETMTTLHDRGYLLAIVSGTIQLTLELLLDGLALERIYTNRIDFDEKGRISGWQATPFDVQGKAHALDELAREYGLELSEMAFVGDHWNDLAAMRKAGCAVAFDPKDAELCEVADIVIAAPPLDQILAYFPEKSHG